MQYHVGGGAGEVFGHVLLPCLPPRITGDIYRRHPVQCVVAALREAAVVVVEAVGSRLDVALAHIVKAAARHGDVPPLLPAHGVVGRHGACRLALRACGGHGEGRTAQPVVVLHRHYGVRTGGVEHRHGLDIVTRSVLRTDCTGQCRKYGKCRDDCRKCLVPVQFPTPVTVRVHDHLEIIDVDGNNVTIMVDVSIIMFPAFLPIIVIFFMNVLYVM